MNRVFHQVACLMDAESLQGLCLHRTIALPKPRLKLKEQPPAWYPVKDRRPEIGGTDTTPRLHVVRSRLLPDHRLFNNIVINQRTGDQRFEDMVTKLLLFGYISRIATTRGAPKRIRRSIKRNGEPLHAIAALRVFGAEARAGCVADRGLEIRTDIKNAGEYPSSAHAGKRAERHQTTTACTAQ